MSHIKFPSNKLYGIMNLKRKKLLFTRRKQRSYVKWPYYPPTNSVSFPTRSLSFRNEQQFVALNRQQQLSFLSPAEPERVRVTEREDDSGTHFRSLTSTPRNPRHCFLRFFSFGEWALISTPILISGFSHLSNTVFFFPLFPFLPFCLVSEKGTFSYFLSLSPLLLPWHNLLELCFSCLDAKRVIFLVSLTLSFA